MTTSIPADAWIKKVSGRWSIAANWSGGVPGFRQDVVIAPATAETVTFDIPNFGIGALTLQSATLNLTGGALTVNRGATLTTAALTGSHSLILGGTSTVNGLTVGAGASLRNRGVVTQLGGVAIGDSATSNAGVVNLAGATWNDANDGAISTIGGGYGFVNFGLFEASDATGAASISARFVSTGSVAVAPGAQLIFSGAFDSTGSISVAAGGVLFCAAEGSQTQLSGTANGGGIIEYTAGDVATLGALTVTATNQNNLGTVNQVGTLTLNGAQTINDVGQWNLDGDVSMLVGAGDSATVEFVVYSIGSILAKTAGTGVSTIGASVDVIGGVNVETGTLQFEGATDTFSGAISGAGTFEIAMGAAGLVYASSYPADPEVISVAHFVLSGGTAALSGAVTDSGAFEGTSGATLSLVGELTLTGTADLAGLDVVSGKSGYIGQLIVASATTLSGATVGGAAQLFDASVVTQSGGDLTLSGDVASPTDAAPLTIDAGGVWDITDASGIGLSAGSYASIDVGYGGTSGLFEKTGAGVSVISPVVLNNSSNVTTSGGVIYEGLEAAAGTLDLHNVVGGTGSDNIVGAATLEFDNSVLAGQTVSFFGASSTLDLNDAPAFAGTITGFDTTGSADTLLINAGTYNYAGASETATAATLAFSNGASTFSLTLTGDYQGGNFTASPLGNGQIKITY